MKNIPTTVSNYIAQLREWYLLRTMSKNNHYFQEDALLRHISKSIGKVYMDSDTADRPVRFTIWVTKTEFNFDIIGGIAIEYLNGRNVMFACYFVLVVMLLNLLLFTFIVDEFISK
jgi:hypothetical protein